MVRLVFLLFAAALCVGCQSTLLTPEIDRLRAQIAETQVASQALFDAVAAGERRQAVRARLVDPQAAELALDGGPPADTGVAAALGYDPRFRLEDRLYHATVGDPPLTASYRAALAALDAYNAALLALAEDRPPAEARYAIARSVGSFAPGAGGLSTLPGPLAGSALRALDGVARIADRNRFHRAVLAAYAPVNGLIDEMRAQAPLVFAALIGALERDVAAAQAAGDPDRQRRAIARIEAYRTAVADWTVMLDGIQASLARLKRAIETSPEAAPGLAALHAQAAELRRRVGAVRDSLAIARSPF